MFFGRLLAAPAVLLKTLFATFGSLFVVLPLGLVLLKSIGLPLLFVMLILGAPLLIILAFLGLPIIIVLAIALVVLMALPAIFAVGAIALKIFLFVVLPVWLLVKAVKWVLKPRDGGTPPATYQPPPNTATGDI